jgi:hypothetical protein
MTKFQDPRARARSVQIETINATGWESAYDPVLQNHVVHGGLSIIEGILRFDMFMAKVQEAAKNREAVWASQLSQNISGIEWYTVEYGGITAELPRLHENLKCVPGDKQILMQSKPVALDFLAHWNQVFKVWRYDRKSDERWNRSRWGNFYQEYLQREWMEIWVEEEAGGQGAGSKGEEIRGVENREIRERISPCSLPPSPCLFVKNS